MILVVKNGDRLNEILIDPEDLNLIEKYKWYVDTKGYAKGYLKGSSDFKPVSMHRLILGVKDKHIICDHKDRNPKNNQKSNLRICTKRENNINRISISKSGFMGVSYIDPKNRKYIIARIRCNEKDIYLGTYPTEEDAAKAYDDAAIIYHGEFANLNFPDRKRD